MGKLTLECLRFLKSILYKIRDWFLWFGFFLLLRKFLYLILFFLCFLNNFLGLFCLLFFGGCLLDFTGLLFFFFHFRVRLFFGFLRRMIMMLFDVQKIPIEISVFMFDFFTSLVRFSFCLLKISEFFFFLFFFGFFWLMRDLLLIGGHCLKEHMDYFFQFIEGDIVEFCVFQSYLDRVFASTRRTDRC